jgi:hypothetical protein
METITPGEELVDVRDTSLATLGSLAVAGLINAHHVQAGGDGVAVAAFNSSI